MRSFPVPALDTRIIIRDPDSQPVVDRDAYGRALEAVSWGVEVWANKRDGAPFIDPADGVEVRAGRTTFTIRYRAGVKPTSEIVHQDVCYVMDGAPRERGGANGHLMSRFLELDCYRRSGAATA